jgi:hypothetical protein
MILIVYKGISVNVGVIVDFKRLRSILEYGSIRTKL